MSHGTIEADLCISNINVKQLYTAYFFFSLSPLCSYDIDLQWWLIHLILFFCNFFLRHFLSHNEPFSHFSSTIWTCMNHKNCVKRCSIIKAWSFFVIYGAFACLFVFNYWSVLVQFAANRNIDASILKQNQYLKIMYKT